MCVGITAFLLPALGVSAAPPLWWSTGNLPVIDANATTQNHGVANIGQAKWLAKNALEALRDVLPETAALVEADLVGAGKPLVSWQAPASPSEKEKQHSPLLIGQLKALAAPFYIHLKNVAPQWHAAEMAFYQMPVGDFPWTAATTDDANKSPAVIGQLKAVFSLDFAADREIGAAADGISDLWEWAVVNAHGEDGWTDIGQITQDNATSAGSETGTGNPPSDNGGGGNETELDPLGDDDGDLALNYEVAVPDDPAISWLRSSGGRYAVLPTVPADLSPTEK